MSCRKAHLARAAPAATRALHRSEPRATCSPLSSFESRVTQSSSSAGCSRLQSTHRSRACALERSVCGIHQCERARGEQTESFRNIQNLEHVQEGWSLGVRRRRRNHDYFPNRWLEQCRVGAENSRLPRPATLIGPSPFRWRAMAAMSQTRPWSIVRPTQRWARDM